MDDFLRLSDKEGELLIKKEAVVAIANPGPATRDQNPWCRCVIWFGSETFFVREELSEVEGLLLSLG